MHHRLEGFFGAQWISWYSHALPSTTCSQFLQNWNIHQKSRAGIPWGIVNSTIPSRYPFCGALAQGFCISSRVLPAYSGSHASNASRRARQLSGGSGRGVPLGKSVSIMSTPWLSSWVDISLTRIIENILQLFEMFRTWCLLNIVHSIRRRCSRRWWRSR